MNILSVVIILLLLLSSLIGFKRGVLMELVMLVGIIVIYFISFNLKSKIGIILLKIFPFFSFKGLSSLNIIMYQLIAFVLIASFLFIFYNLVLKLTGIIQKIVNISIILTLPSKLLGLVVGFIKGYIIIFMILLVLQIPFKDNDIFINSKVKNYIVNDSFLLSSSLGNLDDCINDIISKEDFDKIIRSGKLTTKNHNSSNTNQENIEILRLELKYNIISKEDLDKIIRSGKLTGIESINAL